MTQEKVTHRMRALAVALVATVSLSPLVPPSRPAPRPAAGPCHYTAGETFQLHEAFAYNRVVHTPDPTVATQLGPSLAYTDDLITLFRVQAVSPTGEALVRVVRNGMQTLTQPGTLPYHRQLSYPALPLTVTPACSVATGFAGSIPLSLTFLAAVPLRTIRPGQQWVARIASTALGTYGQPYTLTTQDRLVRTLSVPTAQCKIAH